MREYASNKFLSMGKEGSQTIRIADTGEVVEDDELVMIQMKRSEMPNQSQIVSEIGSAQTATVAAMASLCNHTTDSVETVIAASTPSLLNVNFFIY